VLRIDDCRQLQAMRRPVGKEEQAHVGGLLHQKRPAHRSIHPGMSLVHCGSPERGKNKRSLRNRPPPHGFRHLTNRVESNGARLQSILQKLLKGYREAMGKY
jgi:hypothetical protein